MGSSGRIITSADILDGSIMNADVNAAAGIAYGKLALAGSILTGDIKDGEILNADVNAAAAIALAKLAPGAAGVLKSNGTAISAGNLIGTLDLATDAVTQRLATGNFAGSRSVAGDADVDSVGGILTISGTGGDILVLYFGNCSNSNAAVVQNVSLRVDGSVGRSQVSVYSYAGLATYPVPFCIVALVTGLSGTPGAPVGHQIAARHNNVGASGTMTTNATMYAVEFKR